jgi:hypothetical protein
VIKTKKKKKSLVFLSCGKINHQEFFFFFKKKSNKTIFLYKNEYQPDVEILF